MAESPDPPDEADREVEALANEVTSGPACPRCKFPMEPGFLTVRSSSVRTELEWDDPAPGGDRPGDRVEALPSGGFGGPHALRGYRCPECKRLELEYGAGATDPPH